MSQTINWCRDKTRLAIWDKQVFFIRYDTKRWYLNGKRHRENEPAVEYPYGDKTWFKNGEFHRENGPAIEWSNCKKYWYLNGKEYSESTYWKELSK